MTCEWPLILLDEFKLHVHRSKTKSQAFIGVLPDKQLTVGKIWTSVFVNTLELKLVSVITTGHPSTLVEPNFLFLWEWAPVLKGGKWVRPQTEPGRAQNGRFHGNRRTGCMIGTSYCNFWLQFPLFLERSTWRTCNSVLVDRDRHSGECNNELCKTPTRVAKKRKHGVGRLRWLQQ